jgi:hypothetical protein
MHYSGIHKYLQRAGDVVVVCESVSERSIPFAMFGNLLPVVEQPDLCLGPIACLRLQFLNTTEWVLLYR